MIKFDQVFLQYINEFYSLYDFSCEINSHTIFIGDFFDGTSSILRTLSKIDKDYSGNIFIDNINLKCVKDKDLNLVYLPQNPILFKNKNIFKNLYFPLKIRKINKKEAKKHIFNLLLELKNNNFTFLSGRFECNKYENIDDLNILQVENMLKLKIKNLSLSEQKIITLIRSILRKPKYVLLENFFEDLDAEFLSIALYLIDKLKKTSIIIACEKEEKSAYKDFKIRKLTNKKKED